MEKVFIKDEFITLGQLLKETGIIDTGGAAKWFLAENCVRLNGEEEKRRGKKLYNGDVIDIEGEGTFMIVTED